MWSYSVLICSCLHLTNYHWLWVINMVKRHDIVLPFSVVKEFYLLDVYPDSLLHICLSKICRHKKKTIHLNIRNSHCSMKVLEESSLTEWVKATRIIIKSEKWVGRLRNSTILGQGLHFCSLVAPSLMQLQRVLLILQTFILDINIVTALLML